MLKRQRSKNHWQKLRFNHQCLQRMQLPVEVQLSVLAAIENKNIESNNGNWTGTCTLTRSACKSGQLLR